MEKWFTQGLQKWYSHNKRNLPWRHQTDPYKIWVSEIILQQTQVKQGLSYYNKFVKNYPTVKHLAKATEDKVLKDWQGLGYYSRARNMHSAAQILMKENNGNFPKTFEDIKKMKGVGDYTAAAIAGFAYNLPHAVVDGNVYRLLSRIFGIQTPIDSGVGKKQFQALATDLLDVKDPATHNQAIMEFGSQFCKPSNPDCQNCIFKNKCYAFLAGKVAELPAKSKKIKVVNRYFNYLIVADKGNAILINKRAQNDIWKGLYDFLLIETEAETGSKKMVELNEFKKITGKKFNILHISKMYKHVLSHQNLFAKFYVIKLDVTHKKTQKSVKISTLTKYAFPRLIENFLNNCNLNELF